MLELGLMQRDTGVRASRLLGIVDKTWAFAFDRAITARLKVYDDTQDVKRAELIALKVAGLSGDGSSSGLPQRLISADEL